MEVQAVEERLICPDGVELVARVWKPSAPGRWPVLLMRQPYGRAIASTPTYAHPHWYASKGYAVVVQDVRGCGDSGGSFRGFAQEAADSSWTLAWARTLPYANGRLGCYGFSYQGLTQLLGHTAAEQPDCLAPAMAGLDERLHWASTGGAHRWALTLGWGLQLAAERCRRRADADGWREIRRSLDSERFLVEGLALLERLDPGSMVLDWLHRDPRQSEGWTRHTPPAGLLRRPMLLAGGWHDPFLDGVLDLHGRSRLEGGAPMLHLGPWTHLDWDGGIDPLQLAFFDHHLRDRAAPAEPKEWLFDSGLGDWLERSPGQSHGGPWGLRSLGLAAIDQEEGCLVLAGEGGGEVCFVHDPWRPRPARGGPLGLDAGPVDRRHLDRRSDGACFTTAALTAPTELLGRPVLELELEADQPGFDLCGALSVLRGGSAAVEQLSTGVARFLGPECLRRQRRRLELQPLLVTLAAGDRLRLSLAAAAWPQISVNPGTGAWPLGGSGPDHRVITLQLKLDSALLALEPMASGTLTQA